MKILLTGRDGQVGFELQRSLAPLGEIVAVGRKDVDLADPGALRDVVRAARPDILVNAAAYTAVDKAESEPDLAAAINGQAPGVLGEEAKRLGALVVHYSTDYVFDGTRTGAYAEDDVPNPLSVYGRTKLDGERALAASGAGHLIFRTSWVYGAHGANFVKTILRLAGERDQLRVVADQFGAPTSAALIADVTAQVLGAMRSRSAGPMVGSSGHADFPSGLYHLTAGGRTTWHEFASAIIARAAASGRSLKLGWADIQPITTADYPVAARRPANSSLDTARLRDAFSLVLPDWRHGLDHVLTHLFTK